MRHPAQGLGNCDTQKLGLFATITRPPSTPVTGVSLRSLTRLRLFGLSDCVGPSSLLVCPDISGIVGLAAVRLGFGLSDG